MVDRIIKFSQEALLSPATYSAMVSDGVVTWVQIGPTSTFVEIHDTNADDFKNLRIALRGQGFSYDFYQRRASDGDNTCWYHSRSGGNETFSNYDQTNTPVVTLFSCTR